MKRQFVWVATAAFAAGTVGFSQPFLRAADNTNTAPSAGLSGQRDVENETSGVRQLLAEAANAALRPGGIGDLPALFVSENRIGDALPDETTPSVGKVQQGAGTNSATPDKKSPRAVGAESDATAGGAGKSERSQLVTAFNTAWNQKYHQDFQIGNANAVFADIGSGEIEGSEAQTASGRLAPTTQPAPAHALRTGEGNGPTGVVPPAGQAVNAPAPQRPISERVWVHLPAVASAPAVSVRLIREGPSVYRFVVKGEVNRQRLATEIDRQLQTVLNDKSQWPADVHQADRVVTQYVILAISEYESAAAGNAQPASAHITAQRAHPSAELPGTQGNAVGGSGVNAR